MTHPLLAPDARRLIESAVSKHLGRTWRIESYADLAARASHPAVVLRGAELAVFAKLADSDQAASDHADSDQADSDQAASELAGLRTIGELSGVAVPVPVAEGRLALSDGTSVLLFEALEERIDRTAADWRAIGRTLALLHAVSGETFGAAADGFFGPLPQDNRPVGSNRWAEFYAVRRVLPWLRTAYDAGSVDSSTVSRVETLLDRLGELVGPEPAPRLLHGDAQHHNFVSTPQGAVVIDPSPYFGHPEVDLALLDYFSPVPPEAWDGYREVRTIDAGFAERRELWRIFAYLAVLTVDQQSDFGRAFIGRLNDAVDHYLR